MGTCYSKEDRSLLGDIAPSSLPQGSEQKYYSKMQRIGLIDVDGGKNFPNIALMKISAFHKAKGDSVCWYDPFFCLQQIFTEDELGAMTEQELNNLYRLADELTRTFY